MSRDERTTPPALRVLATVLLVAITGFYVACFQAIHAHERGGEWNAFARSNPNLIWLGTWSMFAKRDRNQNEWIVTGLTDDGTWEDPAM